MSDEKKTFKEQMLDFERGIIAAALAESGGRVTRAARSLGLSHQGLCYIINQRHPELLSVRTKIRARRKSKARKKVRRPKGFLNSSSDPTPEASTSTEPTALSVIRDSEPVIRDSEPDD